MPDCTACHAPIEDRPIASFKEPIFGREFAIYRCLGCDVTFSVIPSEFPLRDWYRKADQFYGETAWIIHPAPADDWRFRYFFKSMRRFGLAGELLDVGSGDGRFLERALGEGWQGKLNGVEFNPDMARRRTGDFTVTVSPLEEFLAKHPEPAYDVIVIFDVMEHLAEPGAAVRRIAGMLKPGGYFAATVPNEGRLRLFERESWDFPPNHNTRWTSQSLRALARRNGLKVVDLRVSPFSGRGLSDQFFYPLWRRAVPLVKRALFGREAASGRTLGQLLDEHPGGAATSALGDTSRRRQIEVWLSRIFYVLTWPVLGPLSLLLCAAAPSRRGAGLYLLTRKPEED